MKSSELRKAIIFPRNNTMTEEASQSANANDANMDIKEEELDAVIEPEVDINAANEVDNMNVDGTNDIETAAPTLESRIPAKKDATLREFLGKMDDYAPIVCFPLIDVINN